MTARKSGKLFRIGAGFVMLMVASGSQGCITPYQAEGWRGGYSDVRLDERTFRVSFSGNGNTRSETVETYLLYRCAQLTIQHGFEKFAVLSGDTEKKQTHNVTSASYSSTTTFTGNMASTSGSFSPSKVTVIDRFRSYALIRMYNGAEVNFPLSFDARQLRTFLRPHVDDQSEVS